MFEVNIDKLFLIGVKWTWNYLKFSPENRGVLLIGHELLICIEMWYMYLDSSDHCGMYCLHMADWPITSLILILRFRQSAGGKRWCKKENCWHCWNINRYDVQSWSKIYSLLQPQLFRRKTTFRTYPQMFLKLKLWHVHFCGHVILSGDHVIRYWWLTVKAACHVIFTSSWNGLLR